MTNENSARRKGIQSLGWGYYAPPAGALAVAFLANGERIGSMLLQSLSLVTSYVLFTWVVYVLARKAEYERQTARTASLVTGALFCVVQAFKFLGLFVPG